MIETKPTDYRIIKQARKRPGKPEGFMWQIQCVADPVSGEEISCAMLGYTRTAVAARIAMNKAEPKVRQAAEQLAKEFPK